MTIEYQPVDPWLGPRFEEAVAYALRVHGGQCRKGSSVPYMTHLLGVASLVLDHGGDEDEAIAALLHDAVEDQGGSERYADILARFGERVASIVDSCSEKRTKPKPPWHLRKRQSVAHLGDIKDVGALRVALADKISNATAMERDFRGIGDELFKRFNAPKNCQRWYYESLVAAFSASRLGKDATIHELERMVAALFPPPSHRERFAELLEQASVELTGKPMLPSANAIDPWDLALFFDGMEKGLITMSAGGRFDTMDRPQEGGHWGLISKAEEGGWYNAEYLPRLAAYVEAILLLRYPQERVLFELPPQSLQLDLAILDDAGRVVVMGEAKRDVKMLGKLISTVEDKYTEAAPGPDTKKRGDEARQLARRLWDVRPQYLWMIGPGERIAYQCSFDPLRLERVESLPSAKETSLAPAPSAQMTPSAISPEASSKS